MGLYSGKTLINMIDAQKALLKITGLSPAERETVLDELRKYDGGGGISKTEFKRVIHNLYLNVQDKIGPDDLRYLKKLIS